MRFFCSNMQNPSPWKETSETDERKVITKYFNDHIELFDADCGGEETFYFAFNSGKFFRLDYEWYIDHDPEWSMEHRTTITEIDFKDAQGICSDRDWLILPWHQTGQTVKWPPGFEARQWHETLHFGR